ncbi:hypothetical protein MTR_2g086200 [Medicago truncatula]|uniref:Transposase-associated domain-containing protein n=1 Tax=Medicago truncatula TaxID=3880 RepID=G7ITQ5_MEDTR|nr:hypothetical protein MTR_2g086200 [Medicago truncatula]
MVGGRVVPLGGGRTWCLAKGEEVDWFNAEVERRVGNGASTRFWKVAWRREVAFMWRKTLEGKNKFTLFSFYLSRKNHTISDLRFSLETHTRRRNPLLVQQTTSVKNRDKDNIPQKQELVFRARKHISSIADWEDSKKFAEKNLPNTEGLFPCPCISCGNWDPKLSKEEIRGHLVSVGICQNYTEWIWHGETMMTSVSLDI